ncbi:hypothetical protein [Thalassobacillus sp. B23F22_16]|uniref:hypothetical protein n=1 Tax=Thalassobacillus sp. B23F22_16 TaxID=3459513 RepID=UPI00373F2CB1
MFNRYKEKFSDFTTNGVALKLTDAMLEELIRHKSGEENIQVSITPHQIVISGTKVLKKLFIKKNISFSVVLEPIRIEKRMLVFELISVKPINLNFINNKIFNNPPFINYDDREVKMDFNSWEIVRSVSVGNIKSFYLYNDEIEIRLGL